MSIVDAQPPTPPAVSQWADLSEFKWSARHPWIALALLPGVIACLAVGLLADHPAAGMVAAGGAVSAGFGVFHRITRYRLMPVVLVPIGMTASAWLGAVLGHRDLMTSLLTAGLWGLAFGAATSEGVEHWWLGLQWVVALFISAAYPANPWAATQRVSLLLAGGIVQALLIALIWLVRRESFLQPGPPIRPTPLSFGQWMRANAELLSLRTVGGRYAWRLAIMLMVATYLSHKLDFRSSYWIPMTAAIVVKPQFRSTLSRSAARTAGTILGAILATLLVSLAHPRTPALALLVVLLVWCCFTTLQVNYTIFATCITAYIVFLLAMAGLPAPQVAAQRALATVIGGMLAMGVHVTSLRFIRVHGRRIRYNSE